MPLKKTVAPKKTALKTKAVEPALMAAPAAEKPAAFKHVWALPVAMLMLMVAVAGLWLAARESSNAPQAATPSATHDVMTPVVDSTKPAPAAAMATTAKPAETATSPAVKPVSVIGCLQRGDSGFVLKNAEGTAAPRARSWKSGFLKRSTPAIDLQDAANTAHLASHVGQRVSVTGPLVDREMHVLSLRAVSASCQ